MYSARPNKERNADAFASSNESDSSFWNKAGWHGVFANLTLRPSLYFWNFATTALMWRVEGVTRILHPLWKCICVSGNPHYHPHSLGNLEAHLVLACETRKKLIVKPLGITTHPDIANMDERCWLLAFEECRPFHTCLWMLFFQISSEKLNQRFVPSLWPGKHRAMT